jgi:hypothetical protein
VRRVLEALAPGPGEITLDRRVGHHHGSKWS